MTHCYIFDYEDNQIYHINIPDKFDNSDKIEEYIHKEYGFKESQISYMITENERMIIELE